MRKEDRVERRTEGRRQEMRWRSRDERMRKIEGKRKRENTRESRCGDD